MQRLPRFGSVTHFRALLILAVLVVLPQVARAADVVINNGLAPPNPANVIDDETYADDNVYVRNDGCPPSQDPPLPPWASCPSPGDPTQVEVIDNGEVFQFYLRDSSSVTTSGGAVGDITIEESAALTMNGGTLAVVEADDSSTVTMNGGTVASLGAFDSSIVAMNGGTVDFMLYAFNSSTNPGAPQSLRQSRGGSLLSVSPSMVEKLIQRGELPSFHVGRVIRIELVAIVEFIERNRRVTKRECEDSTRGRALALIEERA